MEEKNSEAVVSSDKKKPVHSVGMKPAYLLAAVIFLAIVLAAGYKLYESDSNRKLSNAVSGAIKNHKSCSDGLKSVNAAGGGDVNSSAYSNATKEKTLSYLMSCYFETGDKTKALHYAAQLRAMYVKDGGKNSQEISSLDQFVYYIKNYK